MFLKDLETVAIDGRNWFKIKEDCAFESIHDGYKEYKKVWDSLVKQKNVVVQAGGYCGVFPRLLAEEYKTVYTFEPDPLNFFCLVMNCQTENVIKAQSAVGYQHDLVRINKQHQYNKGMNTVSGGEGAYIPTFVIDDLRLNECDLIALDTEGYEMKILSGAANTIQNFYPVISVEDSNEDIDKFLNGYGYKLREFVYRDAIYSV